MNWRKIGPYIRSDHGNVWSTPDFHPEHEDIRNILELHFAQDSVEVSIAHSGKRMLRFMITNKDDEMDVSFLGSGPFFLPGYKTLNEREKIIASLYQQGFDLSNIPALVEPYDFARGNCISLVDNEDVWGSSYEELLQRVEVNKIDFQNVNFKQRAMARVKYSIQCLVNKGVIPKQE